MTFTDTLRTIFELKGLSAFVGGLEAAELAIAKAAGGTNLLSQILGTANRVIGNAVIEWGAWIAAMFGAVLVLDATGRAFGRLETELLRTGLLLQNQGRQIPLAELSSWANHIQDVTGVANTHTLALMRQAAAIGFNLDRTKQLVSSAINLEAAGNKTGLLDLVQRAVEFPSSRSMRAVALELKIDPRFITGQMEHDIDYINQQTAAKYGGIAQIMKGTTEGLLTSIASDWQRLLQGWGDALAPLFKALLIIVDSFLKAFTWISEQINYFLNHNWFSRLTHTGSGGDQMALNARAAEGGRPKDDSDHLQQIAQNTRVTAQAIVTATFGNISPFTRQGATFGALNAALSTRG